uniref:AMP-binding domain-containing protein n=1 Tax=Globodera pallida TaxID=36090 RepID=A0A183BXR7_GLOPA
MLCRRQNLSKIGTTICSKWQHRRSLSSSNFVELAGFTASTDSKQYADKKLLLLQDGKHMSYNDVNVASGRYAALLNKQYGIKRGDTVLCRTSKTADALALYLAVLRLGAIYVPLNPTYTKRETEHFVNDAKPKVMVTLNAQDDASFTQPGFDVKHVLCEHKLAGEALKHEASCEVEAAQKDDVACILYTSGTTGRPKGAMVTHGGLAANAETCTEIWNFGPNDVNLHVLPFYHIHGLFISFNCTLMSKSSCIFLPKFELNETISYLPKSTIMMGVPTFYA